MRDFIINAGNWIAANREWIFSGAGVTALLLLTGGIRMLIRRKQVPQPAPSSPPRVDVLSRVLETKELRVGLVHYPPFVALHGDDDSQASGLYVDVLRKFCKQKGVTPRFQQVRFSSSVQSVANDEQDLVLCIFQTPRRSRAVDFCAFMHSVTVSAVVRRTEDRITSQSDLLAHKLKYVVCRGEIGQEILEDQLRVSVNNLTVIDTSNIADIIEMVAAKRADIAIADSLSCQHGLAARGAEGPRLKPVLRRRPLYLCPNGVMIQLNQDRLADWLDSGLKTTLAEPEFRSAENTILEEYHGIIAKL